MRVVLQLVAIRFDVLRSVAVTWPIPIPGTVTRHRVFIARRRFYVAVPVLVTCRGFCVAVPLIVHPLPRLVFLLRHHRWDRHGDEQDRHGEN